MTTQLLLRSALRLFSCGAAATIVLLSACSQAPSEPDPDPSALPDLADPQFAACSRDVIEPDWQPSPLAGAGVDAKTGMLVAPKSGSYIVSTTYLALKPGAETGQRFGALMGPIMAQLKMQRGLAALTFSTSQKCSTARTLSVWEDEASMFDFVASPAHLSAVRAVGEVSRGGSLVHHYPETDVARATSWSTVVAQLKTVTGPLY